MNSLKSVIELNIVNAEKAYHDNILRLENAFKESNYDLPPTLDCDGRFHAPCDGYVCPYDTIKDTVYGKGQYLPLSLDEIELLAEINPEYDVTKYDKYGIKKGKIMLPVSIVNEAIELLKDFASEIVLGKGSEFNKAGVMTCYLYVSAKRKTLVDDIINYLTSVKPAEIEEEKGIAPDGKQTITGTIVKRYIVEGYAYNTYDYKVLIVLDNNSTVYGTPPKKALESVDYEVDKLVGVKLSFTATFQHAKDTDNHAYYKRPSKVTIL